MSLLMANSSVPGIPNEMAFSEWPHLHSEALLLAGITKPLQRSRPPSKIETTEHKTKEGTHSLYTSSA